MEYKGGSKWKDLSDAVDSGWENAFNTDIDGNDLVTGGKYKIATSTGAIELSNKNGKKFTDGTTSLWDATAAEKFKKGYLVLLSGEDGSSKEGQYKVMTTDKTGEITKGTKWKDESTAVESGWENKINADIDKDGLITGGDYKVATTSAVNITFVIKMLATNSIQNGI